MAEQDPAPATKKGWLSRLKAGLTRSSNRVSSGIAGIFTKRKLDDATLEELEDLLITADLGVSTATRITTALGHDRYDKEITPDEVRQVLADEITRVLDPVAEPLKLADSTSRQGPEVILVVGVNGTGKTTTIGKLAKQFTKDGKSVMLAAGDTFRAAAIEQLQIWGERIGAPVIAGKVGGDAAGLAYDALLRARKDEVDLLLIDTAGRLHNKADLMAELAKIRRVLKKLDETAPHHTLLVLDATTGQNALQQVEVFREVTDVSGLVMTKLDGTAKGGILVALAERFGLPVHAIGLGEGADDLRPFSAASYARALVGLADD